MTIRNPKVAWTPFLISPVRILPRLLTITAVMISAVAIGFLSVLAGFMIMTMITQMAYTIMSLFLLLILVSNIVNKLIVVLFDNEII